MIAGKICDRCRGERSVGFRPILREWGTYVVYPKRTEPCPKCLGLGQLPINIHAIVAHAVKDAPADIDKKQLLDEIEIACGALYQHGRVLRQPAVQREELAETIELARKLYIRLAGDARFDSRSWKLWQDLCALTEDTELPRPLGVDKGSAFDNLVVGLATIFRNHFGNKRSPMNFVEAVLAECGISVERRAIADAYTRGRKGRKKAHAKTGEK